MKRTRTKRLATTLAGMAAAVLAMTLISAPAASAAPLEVLQPDLTTTVDGNTVKLDLVDPHPTAVLPINAPHYATVCVAGLVLPGEASDLLPALVSGQVPDLREIPESIYGGLPGLIVSTTFSRGGSKTFTDIPAGIYIGVAACFNPVASGSNTTTDIEPVFVGSPIEVGSAAIELGSTMIQTEGALEALLTLLGVDTGSVGDLLPTP